MIDNKQEDSKKDLALILARISSLIEADNLQKSTAASRDFTAIEQAAYAEIDTLSNAADTDTDENYPELTDVVEFEASPKGYLANDIRVDEVMLNTLMKALKPAIDAAANRAIERIVLDAKQPLKQQLELEIRQALFKLLK